MLVTTQLWSRLIVAEITQRLSTALADRYRLEREIGRRTWQPSVHEIGGTDEVSGERSGEAPTEETYA